MSINSKERYQLRSEALAKRVHTLRELGLSVSETAKECDVPKARVRTLQLLGDRLKQVAK